MTNVIFSATKEMALSISMSDERAPIFRGRGRLLGIIGATM